MPQPFALVVSPEPEVNPDADDVNVKRRMIIASLMRGGITNRWVLAGEVGVPVTTIDQDMAILIQEYKARGSEDPQAAKGLDLDRIDSLIGGVWEAASSGQLWAVDRVTVLIELRAKLVGTLAPVRKELAGPAGGAIPIEVLDKMMKDAGVNRTTFSETKRRVEFVRPIGK